MMRTKDLFFFFFFQAEDGIRDLTVTGVQTCALPISVTVSSRSLRASGRACNRAMSSSTMRTRSGRSEERRVGKSVDLGGRRIIKKKKKKEKGVNRSKIKNREKTNSTYNTARNEQNEH